MAGLLTEYLRSTCSKRFEWGACNETSTDCYWWVVRWLEISQGITAHELRDKYFGKYDTALGCWRLIALAGGIEAGVAEMARVFGLVETPRGSPPPGSVTIMAQPTEPIMSITVGDNCIAALAPTGLVVARRPIFKAWSYVK